ncbi:unnamed protein product [Nippostrongylus brasiliensis]|uniref:Transposase n=1 Tax=Nippostrongylus brasiliensis TaxID=27835 RepID=A0A0N4XXA0_NIPBR|nr:unnamed protein product [Nippostrongylus brasiliensis]
MKVQRYLDKYEYSLISRSNEDEAAALVAEGWLAECQEEASRQRTAAIGPISMPITDRPTDNALHSSRKAPPGS